MWNSLNIWQINDSFHCFQFISVVWGGLICSAGFYTAANWCNADLHDNSCKNEVESWTETTDCLCSILISYPVRKNWSVGLITVHKWESDLTGYECFCDFLYLLNAAGNGPSLPQRFVSAPCYCRLLLSAFWARLISNEPILVHSTPVSRLTANHASSLLWVGI